jgi:NitT/TauT family transport system permease protein
MRRTLLGAAGLIAVFGVAQLVVWLSGVGQTAFPLPSSVLSQAFSMIGTGAFMSAIGWTMTVWAEAMVATVVIGIVLGLLLGTVPPVESALRPVLEFLRPIPSVVLAPLALLIVTNNQRTEVAVVVFAAVWPVLINTIYGLREVDPAARETLRSFGFGRLAVARHVAVPSAAPFMATGVRIAASQAFVVAIAVELITSGTNGIGTYAGAAESGTEALPIMVAVAVWAGVIGLLLNGVFTGAERRFFRWHFARQP